MVRGQFLLASLAGIVCGAHMAAEDVDASRSGRRGDARLDAWGRAELLEFRKEATRKTQEVQPVPIHSL